MERSEAPSIEVTTLEVVVRPEGPLRLPEYPGSMLRGAIGTAFRRVACLTGAASCEGCPALGECVYGLTWERPARPEGFPKRFGTPPKPYAFDFTRLSERRTPHDSLRFRLKLFGDAIGAAFHFCEALRHLTLRRPREEVRCSLASVGVAGPWGEVTPLSPGDWSAPLPVRRFDVARVRDGQRHRVRLRFASPISLTRKGKRATTISPTLFTSSLVTRLELLSWTHQQERAGWDFRRYRALADACNVVSEDFRRLSVKRQSRRSRDKIPLHGVRGELVVDGVSSELLGLWQSAEVVQVGKQTVFGFGVVEVEVIQ